MGVTRELLTTRKLDDGLFAVGPKQGRQGREQNRYVFEKSSNNQVILENFIRQIESDSLGQV